MVDTYREKTDMEEDGKRALRACTECGISPGANGILLKAVWHDNISIFFKTSRAAFWIFGMRAICSSVTALQQSNLDVIMDATSFSAELLGTDG